MSRSIRRETLSELYAPETAEAFITFVTITHPSLSAPIYVCNNNVALQTTNPRRMFQAVEFDYVLAADGAGQRPRARFRIDNIDRRIIEAVRSMDQRRATLTVWLARGRTPDTREAGPWEYHLYDVRADEMSLTAALGPATSGRRAVPKHRYTVTDFPGLYA